MGSDGEDGADARIGDDPASTSPAGPPANDANDLGAQVLARSRARAEAGGERGSAGRTVARGIGQLLITLGVIVLLFVVYEVWVTNIFGKMRQQAATAALDELWATDMNIVVEPGDAAVIVDPGGTVVTTAPGPVADPGERERTYHTVEGAGFAKIYIPTFGSDFVFTIVEGVAQQDLYAGPGHYPQSQYPGQPGNFAMAGHRVNKGAPFDDLGLLESCDALVIETRTDWYIYRVLPMQDEVDGWDPSAKAHCDGVEAPAGDYAGVYGREITIPTDIAQIRPVPHVNSTAVPADAQALITLTTCHPKFSDAQRMIVHGVLVTSYSKADGFLPPEMAEV